MADWSVNWRRVTVLVAVGAAVLALYGRFGLGAAALPPVQPLPPQPVAAAPAEIAPSPGCQDDGAERRRGLPAGTTAARPARPVPFFAERTGALPADGTPTVGGVTLPPGSRCAHRWVSDEPVENAVALADRLAAAFPETGLWPLLWDFNEDPDHYGGQVPARPDAIARLDAEKVLRRATRLNRMPFLGLARGSGGTPGAASAPFVTLSHAWAAQDWREERGQFLILVPCNRPADAAVLIGQPESELISNAAVGAVLRSWEERFGAVVTVVAPGSLDVVATRPPRTAQDALRLAVEQIALAPETGFDPPRKLAAQLKTERRGAYTTPRHWVFGWPD